jgi:lipopolysaccharide export LptBFGC system permease protein LptF
VGILDRHILGRFLWNFALLFAALYLFAVSVDVIINLPRFGEAAQKVSPDGKASALGIVRAILAFHGPRVFQFYQYMMGLVAIGAAGFTCTGLVRSREFVAMMAVGRSLPRATLPIVAGTAGLCLLQAANQELVIPRLADRLMVDSHTWAGVDRVPGWPVRMVADPTGIRLSARNYDPSTETLTGVYAIERQADGSIGRRFEAASAQWDASRRIWVMASGSVQSPGQLQAGDAGHVMSAVPAAELPVRIDPDALVMKQNALYAHMLASDDLARLRQSGVIDVDSARRTELSRLAGPALSLLMVMVAVPFFALREPHGLFRGAVLCAATTTPAMMVALLMMAMSLPGIPPAIGVALPVALLLPVAAWRQVSMPT